MAAPATTRQPSAFKPCTKVTVLTHSSIGPVAGTGTIAEVLQAKFGQDYAVRAVSRSRNIGGADKVPSLSVYIAPKGYEFPAATAAVSGLPRDAVSDVMVFLREQAAKMGLDPNDRTAITNVASALAAKVKKA